MIKQLLMVWRNDSPLAPLALPEGYRFHNWRRGGDEILSYEKYRECWIKMWSAEGIERITKWFDEVYNDALVPDDGFFTILYDEGEPVAVSCIQIGEHTPDSATVHAVAASTDHKGKGLGRIITQAVMLEAQKRGIYETYLTTDDWRIPAVKIYLDLGFRPVLWDSDMRERWMKLLEFFGRYDVPAVDENGADIVLNPSK